ncbi:hypothetical protein CEXT_754981 [Caerostris extrusa]|uniref:Uncharacterized protein n=1 Tax=Caerostris extrusa TaxID=172846 RepID=A0AAV4TLZ4_CAEEX|nr:hypothetical protein CEXT_754981 [Caerostris extrusa]
MVSITLRRQETLGPDRVKHFRSVIDSSCSFSFNYKAARNSLRTTPSARETLITSHALTSFNQSFCLNGFGLSRELTRTPGCRDGGYHSPDDKKPSGQDRVFGIISLVPAATSISTIWCNDFNLMISCVTPNIKKI